MFKQLLISRYSILVLALLTVQGCSSNKPYVEYENTALSHKLEVGEIRTRQKGDLVEFSIDLTNKTRNEIRFQYKFKFFDGDGFEVMPDARPWTRKILSAKETVAVQMPAPNASVMGGKIYIKE